MKKTMILNGMLALLLALAFVVTGCNYTTEVTVERPNYIHESGGDDIDIIEINPVADVQLTVEAMPYGFRLSWPQVIDAKTYHVYREAEDKPLIQIGTVTTNSPLRLMRFYDIVNVVSEEQTLVDGETYTYWVFAEAQQGEVRDGNKGSNTGTASLRPKAQAVLAKPGLELKIDGDARTVIAKMTKPPATYEVTVEDEGEAETVVFDSFFFPDEQLRVKNQTMSITWALYRDGSTTAVKTFAPVDLADFNSKNDVTVIIEQAEWILWTGVTDWWGMSGDYKLEAKYTDNFNNNMGSYFKAEAVSVTKKYENLFTKPGTGGPAGVATIVLTPVAPVPIVEDTTAANTAAAPYVFTGNFFSKITLGAKGDPKATYVLQRAADTGSGYGVYADVTLLLKQKEPYPLPLTAPLLSNLLLGAQETYKAEAASEANVAYKPFSGSYDRVAAIKTDVLGVFDAETLFDVTVPMTNGAKYKYRIRGVKNTDNVDWFESGEVTTNYSVATVHGTATTVSASLGLGLETGFAAAGDDREYTFTPSVKATGLLQNGDHINIYWTLSGEESSTKILNGLKFNSTDMEGISVSNTVNEIEDGDVIEIKIPKDAFDADKGLTNTWIYVDAVIGGKTLTAVEVAALMDDDGKGAIFMVPATVAPEAAINGMSYFKLNK